MRIPIPRAPISTQNLGGFSAPSPAMPRDQGPAQLADVGQSLTVAAQGALRVGLAVQEEIDQAILTQVDTVAGEITRNTVSKFQQLAGKNAVDAYDNLQLRYRDQIAKIGDMAKTPVQKQLAARVMAERMQSGLRRLMAHRDSEARNWAIGESDAAATGAVRDYKASIGDAEKMAEARELAIRHIDENSRLKGYGPKQSKAARLAVTTDMHLGAVDALLAAGRASKAGAYLETYKGEIEPQEAAKAGRVVQRANVADKSQQLVDDMRGKGMAYGDQIQAIDGLFQNKTLTVEERDEAVQRATQADTLDRRAQAAEAADVLTAGEQFIASAQSQRLADNPQLYARAERAGVLPQLLQFEKSRRATTNPVALAEALSLPDEALANVSRAEIVQRYWGQLDKGDLESVLARRDRAAGEGRSGGQGANVLSIDDRVTSAFLKLKKLPDTGKLPQDSGLAVQFTTFRRNVQEQIEAERESGGKVSPQRLQEILDQASLDLVYTEEPAWYRPDTPVPRLLLTPEQLGTPEKPSMAGVEAAGSGEWVPLSAIDAGVRAEMTRRISASGFRVTEQTLADAWVAAGKPKNVREFLERIKK